MSSPSLIIHGAFAALLLPLVSHGIPNPIGLRWMIINRDTPMPPEVLRKATSVSSVIPYLQVLVLGVALTILIRRTSVSASSLGFSEEHWIAVTAVGVVAGCGWLGLYLAILAATRPSKDRLSRHAFVQRPPSYWIPLSLAAALVEEVWRAFCLISLSSLGQGFAIVVTSLAFGLAHYQPLGRAVSTTVLALYLGVLFLATGALLAPIAAHTTVNLGTIWLVRRAYHQGANPAT